MSDIPATLRRIGLRAVVAACAVALISTPASTLAQEPELISEAGPEPQIEIQFWVDAEASSGFLLVASSWPEDLELPATVLMPLPEGAQPDWVGEITGLGVQTDIRREFAVVPAEGGSAIELTLETTRTAQYEARYLPTETDGNERTAILTWIQSSPASRTLFSVRMPADAEDVSIDPLPVGEPVSNRLGETLYALTPQVIETGDTLEVRVEYTRGSLLEADSSDTTVTTVIIIGIIVSILVLALGIVLRRQGMTPVATENDAEEELIEGEPADENETEDEEA